MTIRLVLTLAVLPERADDVEELLQADPGTVAVERLGPTAMNWLVLFDSDQPTTAAANEHCYDKASAALELLLWAGWVEAVNWQDAAPVDGKSRGDRATAELLRR